MGHAGRGPHIVVFIGPAGSGKTSLTLAFGRWVERTQGLRVAYVNLDPGAETVPYDPGFDVRRYVRVSEVMRRYGLGPNGAFLMSAELMLERVDEIIKGVGSLDADYVLVDTPGQMELFVFHRLGPEMTARLAGIGTPVAVVILDPTLIRGPADVVALRLLTTLVQLRLSVESVPVVNKADVGCVETDEGKLLEKLEGVEGLGADLATSLVKVLNEFRQATRIPLVSARTGEGMEELYDILHEIFCTCGDLT